MPDITQWEHSAHSVSEGIFELIKRFKYIPPFYFILFYAERWLDGVATEKALKLMAYLMA